MNDYMLNTPIIDVQYNVSNRLISGLLQRGKLKYIVQ